MSLTQKRVADEVAHIARTADHDPDYAADRERCLWASVLAEAAEGKDVARLAQTALGTQSHVFGRH